MTWRNEYNSGIGTDQVWLICWSSRHHTSILIPYAHFHAEALVHAEAWAHARICHFMLTLHSHMLMLILVGTCLFQVSCLLAPRGPPSIWYMLLSVRL